MNQDEVMGVINIDTQMMTGAFAEKDLQILMGFARQASLTLQQVHLSAEMQKKCVHSSEFMPHHFAAPRRRRHEWKNGTP